MENAKRIVIVLILGLVTTGTAVSAESQISNTRTASCLVKITANPDILPLNYETIESVMGSSNIAGRAGREVLGLPLEQSVELFFIEPFSRDPAGDIPPEPLPRRRPADLGEEFGAEEYGAEEHAMTGEMTEEVSRPRPRTSGAGIAGGLLGDAASRRPGSRRVRTDRRGGLYDYGEVETAGATRRRGRTTIPAPPSPGTEQTILLQLSVFELPDEVKPAAEEFMNVLVKNLDVALRSAYEDHIQRLRSRLELAEEEAVRTERELRDMQERLRSISGSRILDRGRILGDIMEMHRSLQETKMDQGSDQVIVDAITERIAETQAKLKEQVMKDDVTREMQQMIERQMRQIAKAKKLAESPIDEDRSLAEAEEKLSRTRIELAQRREQMSKAAGGNLIESLNRELADRSVRAAQYQARIAGLSRQLAEAEELLNKADEHELLSLKAEIAKQNLQEALLWRDRISRQIRLIQPPMVSVFGGE